MTDTNIKSLTPDLPIYANARHFLRILDGVAYTLYRSTYNAIWEQRGNPQETASWTDPDSWIPQRLQGDEQALATRIWHESQHALNPRYMRGCWYLAARQQLLATQENGVLHITERGRQFLDQPASQVVAEIDSYEGILTILQLVAERGPGWRSGFLPEYATYCRTFTSFHSETVIKGALYDRLFNLIDRTYVARSGLTYEITDASLAYLDRYASLLPGRTVSSKQSDLHRLAAQLSREACDQLAGYLATMSRWAAMGQFPERKRRTGDTSDLDPYKADLLERWQAGYHNIAHLWRDIQSQGFTGSYRLVYGYLAPLGVTVYKKEFCTLRIFMAF